MTFPGRVLSLLVVLGLVAVLAPVGVGAVGAPLSVSYAHVSIQHVLLTSRALGEFPYPGPADAPAAADDDANIKISLAMIDIGLSEPVHVSREDEGFSLRCLTALSFPASASLR